MTPDDRATVEDYEASKRVIQSWLRAASIRTWNDLDWLARDFAAALATARREEREAILETIERDFVISPEEIRRTGSGANDCHLMNHMCKIIAQAIRAREG